MIKNFKMEYMVTLEGIAPSGREVNGSGAWVDKMVVRLRRASNEQGTPYVCAWMIALEVDYKWRDL